MPLTYAEVVAALSPEGPRYEAAAAELGREAAPHLEKIVKGAGVALATKAAYLATLIGTEAAPAVRAAAVDQRPVVRVAAASGLRNLATDAPAKEIATALLADDDAGVRRTAVRAARSELVTEMRDVLENMAKDDPDPAIRGLSREALAASRR